MVMTSGEDVNHRFCLYTYVNEIYELVQLIWVLTIQMLKQLSYSIFNNGRFLLNVFFWIHEQCYKVSSQAMNQRREQLIMSETVNSYLDTWQNVFTSNQEV